MLKNLFWIVINKNGTYAGIPCLSWEEARELAVQEEGRRIFVIDGGLDEVTNSPSGLI